MKRENLSIGSGRRSAFFNLIKLKFVMVYPYLKLHILFNSNGLATLFGFPHNTKIIGHFGRYDLVSVRFLPNFELNRAISECEYMVNFRS